VPQEVLNFSTNEKNVILFDVVLVFDSIRDRTE